MQEKRRNGREHLLRTRSRICAVSISKACARGGRACCKDQRQVICRGICCSRSSPIGFKLIASGISTTRQGSCWIVPVRRNPVRQCRRGWSASYRKRTELTPGTVLVREWDRHSQRVMVMPDGFAWNGQTYDSLSKSPLRLPGDPQKDSGRQSGTALRVLKSGWLPAGR